MNTPAQWPRTTWTAREPAQAHRRHQLPWYGCVAIVAGVMTIGIFALMHVIMANEVRVNVDPVSVYAINRDGALLFGLASMFMAVGCVSVLFGSVGAEAVPRWCLAGSAVSLLLVVGFDTDAGETVSTIGGYVHRYAAGTVFVLISAATMSVWRRHRGTGFGRAMGILLAVNLVLLVVNWSATYLPELANGGQWRGIPQRLLLLVQVVLFVMMALAPPSPDRPRRPTDTLYRLDQPWPSKDWLTGRGTAGWGALPSADGL